MQAYAVVKIRSHDIYMFYIICLICYLTLFKEWVSFFLGSWEWIRAKDKQIAWTTSQAVCLFRSLIYSPWTLKKSLIPYIYNVSNKDPL